MPRQIQKAKEEGNKLASPSASLLSPSCAAMEALHERARHSSFVVEWLRGTFYIGESGSLSKLQVYKEYLRMCADNKLSPVKNAILGKLVHRAFPNILSKRRGRRGESRQHYFQLNYLQHNNNNNTQPQQTQRPQQTQQQRVKKEHQKQPPTSIPWTFISSNQNQLVTAAGVGGGCSSTSSSQTGFSKKGQNLKNKWDDSSDNDLSVEEEREEEAFWLLSEERGQESLEHLWQPKLLQPTTPTTSCNSTYLARSPQVALANHPSPSLLGDYSPPTFYGQPAYHYNNSYYCENSYYYNNNHNNMPTATTPPQYNYVQPSPPQRQHYAATTTADNSNLLLCELLWDGESDVSSESCSLEEKEGGRKNGTAVVYTLEEGFKKYYEDLLVAVLLDDPSEIKAVIRRFWLDDVTPNCFLRIIRSIVDNNERDRRIIDAEWRGITYLQEHLLKYPNGFNRQQENAFLGHVATKLPVFVQEVTSNVVSKEIIIIQLRLWTQFAMKVFGAAQASYGM